jgi:hypothetical protein
MPKQSIKYLALPAFVGILILHHFGSYLGHFGYDDMHYARLAHYTKNKPLVCRSFDCFSLLRWPKIDEPDDYSSL